MTDPRLTKINMFRSTEEERQRWEAVASAADATLSEFFREAANQMAAKGGDDEGEERSGDTGVAGAGAADIKGRLHLSP